MTELAFVIFADDPEMYAEGLAKDYALHFEKEKHGTGPEHWAGYHGTQLFEIYPLPKLGLMVRSVSLLMENSTNLRLSL